MKKIKSKMPKKEVKEIKEKAKNRKNRFLEDGEYARLIARATSALGLKDSAQDLPILETQWSVSSNKNSESNKNLESNKINASNCSPNIKKLVERMMTGPTRITPNGVTSKHVGGRKVSGSEMQKMFSVGTTGSGIDSSNAERKNRRLTDKQYKKLMKRATKEIGLSEDGDIGVMDLTPEPDYFGFNNVFARLLECLSYSHKEVVKEYKSIVRRIRGARNSDKLAIINYLLNRPEVHKPMCMLSEKEKINEIRTSVWRKEIGPCGPYIFERKLKSWGDIISRPFRVIPDDEYFLEYNGRQRTKIDAFDKMSTDKKIQWARYANLIMRIGSDDLELINAHTKKESDQRVAFFAMEYACKMMNMSKFKGIFENLYWILYRIIKYHMEMTTDESGVFCKISMGYARVNPPKNTIPILDRHQVIRRIIPTLKKRGLYKRFVSESHKSGDELLEAKKLLLGEKR